jgi:hypothetical protein
MITITHCPKFGIYLASIKQAGGWIELDYAADHKIATKSQPIAYTRSEQVRTPATHVLAVASTPHEAEIKAKIKLTRS